ncbi:MAG TPA: hypothetical protein VFY84_10135, partial [Jiangellales bacterium]|nr:hypothetical protein [Jiangellales bacterium]
MDVANPRVDVTPPEAVERGNGGSARLDSWMTGLSTVSSRTWALVLLGVAVIAGGALRVVGARYGFPFFVHPDEGTIVHGAMDLSARRSFEPQALFRPDHLEIKLNFLAD